MALTAQERAVVESYIIKFLQTDFIDTLSLYYAEGVAYSSRHPQNINNELRNALTHLARALNAPSMHEAQDNMDSAGRHIERFKRDCLKVAVIYSGKDVNNLLTHAHRRFKGVDPSLTIEASKIVRSRVDATIKEAIGIEQSVPTWEALALRIGQLRERIFALYPSLDPKKIWLPLWAYKLWDIFKFVTASLVLGVLAGIILLALIPDQQGAGNSIRHAISEFVKPAPAANTPSNGVILDVAPPPKQLPGTGRR
jgi:hypothetical protein